MGGKLRKKIRILQEFEGSQKYHLERILERATAFKNVPKRLKRNKVFILNALYLNPNSFKYFNEDWRGDRGTALYAVRHNGMLLQYVPKSRKSRFRKDIGFNKKIITEAVAQNSKAFQFAPRRLKRNKRFLLKLLKKYPEIIEFIPRRLMKKEKFMLKVLEIKVVRELANVGEPIDKSALKKIAKFVEGKRKNNNLIEEALSEETPQTLNEVSMEVLSQEGPQAQGLEKKDDIWQENKKEECEILNEKQEGQEEQEEEEQEEHKKAKIQQDEIEKV